MNRSLGEHGVVLELRLSEWGSVAGNDDQLGLARAKSLDGRLVAKGDCTWRIRHVSILVSSSLSNDKTMHISGMHTLAGLHNKRKARVDVVTRLLSSLLRCHRDAWIRLTNETSGRKRY